MFTKEADQRTIFQSRLRRQSTLDWDTRLNWKGSRGLSAETNVHTASACRPGSALQLTRSCVELSGTAVQWYQLTSAASFLALVASQMAGARLWSSSHEADISWILGSDSRCRRLVLSTGNTGRARSLAWPPDRGAAGTPAAPRAFEFVQCAWSLELVPFICDAPHNEQQREML